MSAASTIWIHRDKKGTHDQSKYAYIELVLRHPHLIAALAHGRLHVPAFEEKLEAIAFALRVDAEGLQLRVQPVGHLDDILAARCVAADTEGDVSIALPLLDDRRAYLGIATASPNR